MLPLALAWGRKKLPGHSIVLENVNPIKTLSKTTPSPDPSVEHGVLALALSSPCGVDSCRLPPRTNESRFVSLVSLDRNRFFGRQEPVPVDPDPPSPLLPYQELLR